MKKLIFITCIAVFMLNVSWVNASEPPKDKKARSEIAQTRKETLELSDAEIQKLTARVNEINQLDLKSLTRKEKKELKKELRDIKEKLNITANGIYIGGGALLVIIVIILLLI